MGRQRRRMGWLGAALIVWALAPASSAAGACPNEALRTGSSAHLPDCRAYEMVTPADSNGRLFGTVAPWQTSEDLFATEPVGLSGDSFVFETIGGPFDLPPGGNGQVVGDTWQAARGAGGWRITRHVTPTGEEAVLPNAGGISADHTYNFVVVLRDTDGLVSNGSLATAGDADYLGDPSGHFELTGLGSLGLERLVQGRYISPGGKHVIFSTGRSESASVRCNRYQGLSKHTCPVAKLEPNAPPAGTGAVYDREADGPTHVVSLLPGNVTPAAGQEAFYQGASADGSSVAFKIGPPTGGSPVAYPLYVRADNGKAGERTELVSSEASTFGGISADGRYLYYLTGVSGAEPDAGDIHRFDTTTEADEEVTSSSDAKMVNVSADGTHLYFISPSQLDGGEGTAGEPNLYVWSGGTPRFVATVDKADTEGTVALTTWTSQVVLPKVIIRTGPGRDPSRTTPDGKVIAFESRAQLTPYDTDGHIAIYRYDEETESVVCVSCNPRHEPAIENAQFQNRGVIEESTLIHNLSADASRVFFESPEALVADDHDAVGDVYEWQQTPGGGELGLISSGSATEYIQLSNGSTLPPPSLLMGVSSDGEDVFFAATDPLVPGAPVGGAPMIYDARVNGGFPPPLPPPAPCVEEGCRPPATPPPELGASASAELQDAGNPRPRKRKHRRYCRGRAGKSKRCHKSKARGSAGAPPLSSGTGSASVPATAAAEEPAVAGLSAADTTEPSAPLLSLAGGEWGIEAVGAELSTTQAAGHPDFTASVSLPEPPQTLGHVADPRPRDYILKLPPGLYGNPNLVPRCRTGDFLGAACPIDSQVGVSRVLLHRRGQYLTAPLFNLTPVHPEREIGRFGLLITRFPTFIDVSVDTAGDYGITAAVRGINSVELLEGAETTIWGDPADPAHDKERMTIQEGSNCQTPCTAPGEERPTEELGPVAFMTNPSACQEGDVWTTITSYQFPGQAFSASAPLPRIENCQGLPFAPSFEARPTSDVAGAPTGLKTELTLPQTSDPSQLSTATMREAKVTLPAGMAINPAAADGLAACSAEQVHFHQELNVQCPDASKLGTATISSPALPHPLQGALYQRSPEGKGSLFGLWLVSDDLGLHIKIPGQIKPDPQTGQITTIFADLPQVPVSEIDLDIWGGARAPLKNPDACGTYKTATSFKPHSDDPPVLGSDSFAIERGPGGGPCLTDPAAAPNAPDFEAGTESAVSAAYTPLGVKLRREDGSQPFGSLEVTLPPGLLGKLAGVASCSEEALAAAAARSGVEELASPSCPAQSRVGGVWAAAGAGPAPFWAHGDAYLAGPYKGAPLSLAILTPAVAGPFDLGTVVVRSALELDPEDGRITVKSDPIPQILEGVPLNLRTIAVRAGRDQFIRTGTSCNPLAFSGTLISALGQSAPLSERYQLGECRRLPFAPKLALAFKGPTKRTSNPALTADLRARPGEAGIARARVTLPHAVFLDNSHIGTVCTRVQFAADKCPKRSVYGKAWATSPLVDYKLQGPVYLRSSDHELPDLVIKLKGPPSQPLELDLVGRIDSVRGAFRNTFETVPDAPVSRFHLQLFGGKRGPLVLSEGLCKDPRAKIGLVGQNGKRYDTAAKMETSCPAKKKKGRRHR
ncbi:MAG: hypothetical protein ACJ76B_11050 [Solirubrobacterales bacterium]